MQRTLLSFAALSAIAATLSAQCVQPTGTQTLTTTLGGNYIYGNGTPPLYGTSQDPGPGYRCDLTVTAPISISAVAVSLWNDGQNIAGIPTPNLIGVPGCQIELWGTANGGTVTNAANYTIPYTRVPAAGPDNTVWTLLGTGNMTVAGLGLASVATFTTPINMAPGSYGIEFVLVAPYALPAGTDAIRIHPRMQSIPVSGGNLVTEDQFIKIEHGGITSPAFSAGALNHLTTPAPGPFIPDIQFRYTVTPPFAYSTAYGAGCYDRKKTFYQSFNGAPNATGTVPNVTAAFPVIDMLPLGSPTNQYFVQPGAGSYPLMGTPGSTNYFDVSSAGATPTHVNNANGAVAGGGWDDTNSVLYTLPFPLVHPGGTATQISICSNGYVGLGSTAGGRFFFDGYGGLLLGPAKYMVAFGDLWPADNATALGGVGEIYADSDGATWVAISWVGVQEYPNNGYGTTNNSFQVVFNISGIVQYAYGTVANSASAPMVIGYTPGNGAGDPGTGATARAAVPQPGGGMGPYVTGIPFLSGDGALPAVLSSVGRPKVGDPLILRTSNLDPAVGAVLSFISATSLPGIDLGGILSMPGCNAYILLPEIVNQLTISGFGTPSVDQNYGIIPALAGFDVFAQSAALCAHNPPFPGAPNGPPFNGPDILVSNGLCLHIENN